MGVEFLSPHANNYESTHAHLFLYFGGPRGAVQCPKAMKERGAKLEKPDIEDDKRKQKFIETKKYVTNKNRRGQ